MKVRPNHQPDGSDVGHWPDVGYSGVCDCGLPAIDHSPDLRKRFRHSPIGDPCAHCGEPAQDHQAPRKRRPTVDDSPVIVIDGEGVSPRGDGGPHNYVYAAAVDEYGTTLSDITNRKGLTTAESLWWMTELAYVSREGKSPHLSAFIFSGGYDLTKMFQDLPDKKLWLLARPEERVTIEEAEADSDRIKPRKTKEPVYWPGDSLEQVLEEGGYLLHYVRGCLSVQRVEDARMTKPKDPNAEAKQVVIGPKLTLWDCWSFFACSLVKALENWRTGSKEEVELITRLKADRGTSFKDHSFEDVKEYCQLECKLTAQMMRKLLNAHREAGLVLKTYFGAGSCGAAMLTKWGAKEWIGPTPDLMKYAVACAYTGGRFEVSQIGYVYGHSYAQGESIRKGQKLGRGPVYGYDVSSAYPYAQSQGMPCMAHGEWMHVSLKTHGESELHELIMNTRYALVRASSHAVQEAWGAFPWRATKSKIGNKDTAGNITYPLNNPGAWVWKPEYVAAARAPHCWEVHPLEAWLYGTECDCTPFSAVPIEYMLRLKLGKEGPGLVIKLGMNSTYGKTCQSQGENPPYQQFVWAGLTTSHCRAQLLDGIAAAHDPWDVVQVATDGLFSRVPLRLPEPNDTGSSKVHGPDDAKCDCGDVIWSDPKCKRHIQKPLGGWEEKVYDHGIFIVRPGAYFPLGVDEKTETDTDREAVRARGVGRRSMASSRAYLEMRWRSWQDTGVYPPPYKFDSVPIFIGFKGGIKARPVGKLRSRNPGDPVKVKRTKMFGRWLKREQQLSFVAWPKRAAQMPLEGSRLAPWVDPPDGESRSQPYGPAIGMPRILSADARALMQAEIELLDQPGGVDGEELMYVE